MNSKAVILILALLLFMGTATSWWNQSWEYRKPINVTEQSGNNLENYQLELTVDTATLISDGKMQSDCGDIRLINSTGSRLDYWIKNGCNTVSTNLVVELTDLESNSKEKIYLYYGNNSVSSESSPYSTYLFFDDFETDLSKWNTNGGVSISSSHLILDTGDSGATWQGAFSKETFNDANGDIEIRLKDVSHTYNYDDNNLNVGLVDPSLNPNDNPDGADPKVSIEHTESYSGSRAEFVCGGTNAPDLTPDYSNGNWSIIYHGSSAEIDDGTETVSSSTVCDTDYEFMFSIEKESGPDRLEVDSIAASRYVPVKPSVEIGPEEQNEICDRRGPENQCIVDSRKQISGKNLDIQSKLFTESSAVIESYNQQSSIMVSNTSYLSGSWLGNILLESHEIVIKPGARFAPYGQITLNDTG